MFDEIFCIVHQGISCAQALKMDNIMQIIIRAMNFIKFKGFMISNSRNFLKVWMLIVGRPFTFLKPSV